MGCSPNKDSESTIWHYGYMATRKMTFTLPEELAAQLLRRIPAQDRSRYVSEALAARLRGRDERMLQACEMANRDVDVLVLERDFDAFADRIGEPWDDAPAG